MPIFKTRHNDTRHGSQTPSGDSRWPPKTGYCSLQQPDCMPPLGCSRLLLLLRATPWRN
ncbi:uncharacterized protein CANTADRAFT_27460 [Suhomyces tanzawaensis NRRL Y-17324]|uniref:Uncharacterized protein n=1 Tax=Suhomyces tanzawaensis NRRL Y-17324 TaxID=984487 RepID=A0A1E4SC48_9ASCO|nr:uncharacterized protein CANTADRAFT_27460 [Suhomyces tanzawaensis NRRL Y-17324]ODV77069.1 hypothetical protein CANTADRAFT_27460 [Suhomyces tanzawaensis NRRL Y-17324]